MSAVAPTVGAPLPAWPILTLLYGFPLIWAFGLMQFAPSILAMLMIVLMVMRRRVLVHSTMWIWFALMFWGLVCTVSLENASELLGWLQRYMNIFNVGIYTLYFFNARERIPNHLMLGGLLTIWFTVVILGYLALAFPDFRLRTPMSFLLPGSLLGNDLVRDYVLPPMAEVQMPWGVDVPYVRPSAPFPYANSWGLAYALLTPVVFAVITGVHSKKIQVGLGLAVVLSLVPAVATSNRGMFIGLGSAFAYVLLRLLLKGDWRALGIGAVLGVGVVSYLFVSGAVGEILGRQEFSDSTGGRASLYTLTFEYTLRSPLVGYGTSKMADSVGVSMGTQGQVWALMFCFGFVGLGLFLLYVISVLVNTWNIASVTGMWVHSVIVSALAVVFFYSFDVIQLTVLMFSAALMMRSRMYGEGL
ncbi:MULTISPECIES: O-antigen ligase family protein [Rothia]|uniref:Ligase n=1 Tax=Rothia nasimurium TaxID=85336 RepID=A0A1Y1RND1_9MICC|nr:MULTISPECIES: O-antigen ligase family protein [Rothia]ORC15618.1 ligase [Rothia nasimurium]